MMWDSENNSENDCAKFTQDMVTVFEMYYHDSVVQPFTKLMKLMIHIVFFCLFCYHDQFNGQDLNQMS